jgi:hypothetical protein
MASIACELRTGGNSGTQIEGPGARAPSHQRCRPRPRSRVRRAARRSRRGRRRNSNAISTPRPARFGEGGGKRAAARATQHRRCEATRIGRGARVRPRPIARSAGRAGLARRNRARGIVDWAEHVWARAWHGRCKRRRRRRGAGRATSERDVETSKRRASSGARLTRYLNFVFKFKYEKFFSY